MQSHHGVLLNEALHWLSKPQRDTEQAIFDFDLAKEEFRKVPLPVISEFDDMNFHHSMTCLTLGQISRLKIFDHSKPISTWTFKPVFVTENGTAVAIKCSSTDMEWIRIGKKEEKLDDKNDEVVVWDGRYTVNGCHQICDLIEYDETLLWVNDYGGLELQGKRLKTQHI
ncbi:unnamed protein product [Prunus armeniaca]|uniref:Uncharacterized protein n=1 Tax=Prunus armeniaca TaxID=36596 RepID=A0A6J5XPY0_PRUAR|nr:unnamed protein product [Prunus armeniaca]